MEAIAQNKATTIEDLPNDALKEIVIRVAGPPNGAIDVARAFAVSTIFQNFSEDEQVLKAVAFRDLSAPDFDKSGIRKSDISTRYESFEQAGGFLLRCVEAKNSEAELILAKVIMVVVSRLHDAGKSGDSDECRLTKSRNFLKQLSSDTAKNGDRLVHFDLVWKFLSQAKVADLFEMKFHLKDFVSYYLNPGMQSAHERFLSSLDDFDKAFSRIAATSDLPFNFIENFNDLCDMISKILQRLSAFEEEELRPLQESLFQMTDQARPETVLQRLNVIEPMLASVDILVDERSPGARVIFGRIYEAALLLKLSLICYTQTKFILQNVNSTLASHFGVLFCG